MGHELLQQVNEYFILGTVYGIFLTERGQFGAPGLAGLLKGVTTGFGEMQQRGAEGRAAKHEHGHGCAGLGLCWVQVVNCSAATASAAFPALWKDARCVCRIYRGAL